MDPIHTTPPGQWVAQNTARMEPYLSNPIHERIPRMETMGYYSAPRKGTETRREVQQGYWHFEPYPPEQYRFVQGSTTDPNITDRQHIQQNEMLLRQKGKDPNEQMYWYSQGLPGNIPRQPLTDIRESIDPRYDDWRDWHETQMNRKGNIYPRTGMKGKPESTMIRFPYTEDPSEGESIRHPHHVPRDLQGKESGGKSTHHNTAQPMHKGVQAHQEMQGKGTTTIYLDELLKKSEPDKPRTTRFPTPVPKRPGPKSAQAQSGSNKSPLTPTQTYPKRTEHGPDTQPRQAAGGKSDWQKGTTSKWTVDALSSTTEEWEPNEETTKENRNKGVYRSSEQSDSWKKWHEQKETQGWSSSKRYRSSTDYNPQRKEPERKKMKYRQDEERSRKRQRSPYRGKGKRREEPPPTHEATTPKGQVTKRKPQSRYSPTYIPTNRMRNEAEGSEVIPMPQQEQADKEQQPMLKEPPTAGIPQEKERRPKKNNWTDRIPTLGEPLREKIQSSKYRDQIPETWFRVTLGGYFSYKDRNFAKRMEDEDKSLMDQFLLADYNVLCVDPYVTAGHIKSFLRIKYGTGPHRLTQLLKTETLHQAVNKKENQEMRKKLGFQLDLTNRTKEFGQKYPIIPHFQNLEEGRESQRTDLFTATYKEETPAPEIQPQEEPREATKETQEPEGDPRGEIMRHQKRPGKGPEQRTTFEENSEGKEGNETETQLHRTELQEMEDGKKADNQEHKGGQRRQQKEGNEKHSSMVSKEEQGKGTPQKGMSAKQTMQSNRARAERILANMGHVAQQWENIEGAATHRSKLQDGIDPKQPPRIQEQMKISAIIAKRRQEHEQRMQDIEEESQDAKKGQSGTDEKTQETEKKSSNTEQPEKEKRSTTQEIENTSKGQEEPKTNPEKMDEQHQRSEGKVRKQTAVVTKKMEKAKKTQEKEATTTTTNKSASDLETVPLRELKMRRKEEQDAPIPETLTLYLEPRKNDMSVEEVSRMTVLEGRRNGHSRYDYTSPKAKIIYRCPIGGCAEGAKHSSKGQPVNPNGIARKLKSHIAQEHPDIGKNVLIRIIRRNRRSRDVFIPCPKMKPRRNRSARAWRTKDGLEGPSQPDKPTGKGKETGHQAEEIELHNFPLQQSSQSYTGMERAAQAISTEYKSKVRTKSRKNQQQHSPAKQDKKERKEAQKSEGINMEVQETKQDAMEPKGDQTSAGKKGDTDGAVSNDDPEQPHGCDDTLSWEKKPSATADQDSLEFEENESEGTISSENGNQG